MFSSTNQSGFGRTGGLFVNKIFSQPFRKEAGDGSVIAGLDGNLYKLESVLGVGGFSVVYRARRFSDGKNMALKVANAKKGGEGIQLLSREAELMPLFEHDHIVRFYDSGQTPDGDSFVAIELLQGTTLEQLLMAERSLDLGRAARIFLQVAEALEYVHSKGVIHRDVKPANIMLVKRKGLENAVIFDFGISMKAGSGGWCFEEFVSGSMLYASPEQLDERTSGFQTDVYQLALVMFQALAGCLPFEVSTKGVLDYRRGHGAVLPSDCELSKGAVPPEIRAVLERALQRNPGKRTRSMQDFILDLSLALRKLDLMILPDSRAGNSAL